MLTTEDLDIIDIQTNMDLGVYAKSIETLKDVENEIFIVRTIMTRLETDVKFRQFNLPLHKQCVHRFNKMFAFLLMRRDDLRRDDLRN